MLLTGRPGTVKKNKITVDYVKMAVANAKNIKKHMKNNAVAVVTDAKGKKQIEDTLDTAKYFDYIIVTKPHYDGVGPETNIHVNKRSMRVGTSTITVLWQNQSRPDLPL